MADLIDLQEERAKRFAWPEWCGKDCEYRGALWPPPKVELQATGKACSFCGKKLNRSKPGDQNAPAS